MVSQQATFGTLMHGRDHSCERRAASAHLLAAAEPCPIVHPHGSVPTPMARLGS